MILFSVSTLGQANNLPWPLNTDVEEVSERNYEISGGQRRPRSAIRNVLGYESASRGNAPFSLRLLMFPTTRGNILMTLPLIPMIGSH